MDETSAIRHIEAMQDAPYIAVDTETTGLKVRDGSDYLMGISVAYALGSLGKVSAYFPFRHETDNLPKEFLYRLQAVLEEKPLIFHNIKFDFHALATVGIHPRGRCFDTAGIAHFLDEELTNYKLDFLAWIYLKKRKKTNKFYEWGKAFGFHTVPVGLTDAHAREDAELTYEVFEYLWPKLREEDLAKLWPREFNYCLALKKMESIGVRVDQAFCSRKIELGESRMAEIEDELGFTPSRPTELAPFLFETLGLECKFFTDKNRPKLDKKALEYYDEQLEVMNRDDAKLVLEYRGWQKAISALYLSALKHVSSDGRVRTNFNEIGTKTGRLSSSEPNLQQIPRNSEKAWNGDAKKAFIPEENYELWEFDYAQLEYRLAAVYGDESLLLDIFARDDDPFLPTATEVFGGIEFRQPAKTLTYTTLYGGGIERIKSALGLTEDSAKAVRENFRRLYPGIYQASDTASKLAARRGYVKYWTGRRRHFKNPEYAYKAFNSVIQGGAAELVKDALLRVDDVLSSDSVRLVLTVHDSLVLEIRKDLVEATIPQVIKLMTDFPEIRVKLTVDAHRWGGG